MSHLTESLSLLRTGQRMPLRNSSAYTMATLELAETSIEETATEYHILATFGARAMVVNSQGDEAKILAVERVKRAVAEAVFGEFRPLVHNLTMAIQAGDFEKALELVDDLHAQLFQS